MELNPSFEFYVEDMYKPGKWVLVPIEEGSPISSSPFSEKQQSSATPASTTAPAPVEKDKPKQPESQQHKRPRHAGVDIGSINSVGIGLAGGALNIGTSKK